VLTDDAPPVPGGVATWTGWAVDALQATAYARARPGLDPRFQPTRGRHFGRWGGVHLAWAAIRDLWRADAVLATTWPVAVGAAAVLPRDTPLHVVLHGSDLRRARAGRARVLVRVLARRATWWAVSADLACRARSLGLDTEVLPVPIPAHRAVGGGERWLCIARAIPSKGVERFLHLAARAGVRSDVVGEGPERRRWAALVSRLDAPITLHGALRRAELEPLFQEAALVFLLSRARRDGSGEGLGLTLLEAAARAIPTVGCATGGIPEAAGLVLDRPDDVSHSLEAIERWSTPTRGAEAQAWVRATHGSEPFRAALERR
jgi:glycosyltransferase involved in cell wall biosynthesis